MKIVIIGGVAGGATAAARLRRLSEDYEIVMFEKDEYIAFANCGLPYYIGGIITDRAKLVLHSVESLSKRYAIDIRNNSEVIKINTEKKEVEVLNKKTNTKYFESFDKLIYATGSEPIVPNFPSIAEAENCFTLRNIPDADKIYNYINLHKLKKIVVVIGAGFIGLEMAENLIERGFDVTVIDKSKHILPALDPEMTSFLELEMKSKGVKFILGATVSDISANKVTLTDGTYFNTDLTILAIGVSPLSHLAKEANIKVDERGAVIVNNKFETSNKDIYAVGDVISTTHYITGKYINVPLAWPANRQARLVADIISGINVKYTGVLGTSIVKIFGLAAATTGLNEAQAKANKIDFDSIIIHKVSHAGYYPGATNLTLKILFDKKNAKILGAQAVGAQGVDKRIDVIATAIKGGLLITDLEDLELCYAPPFSSAKDPVNILGYAASNVYTNFSSTFKYNEVPESSFLVDVRDNQEYVGGSIKNSINIPLDDIRSNKNLFPADKNAPIYVFCQVGLRGYLAQRILKQYGYTNVFNLSGGYLTYSTYYKNFDKTIK